MTKTCFVVMGFNERIDPVSGRVLDLDKTYRGIIKPAALEAGYRCFRADEIQHAGIIDVPMYKALLESDLVIADLSTLNANAFFELGVRYALRSRKTIVIAEEGFANPFDTNHISMRFYRHDGKVLDFEEVARFRTELVEIIKAVDEADEDDSPVYTFLDGLKAPEAKSQHRGSDERGAQTDQTENHNVDREATRDAALNTAYSVLMQNFKELRVAGHFLEAASVLEGIQAVQGDEVETYVVHQLALVTYKSESPSKRVALERARALLRPLDPSHSLDAETIGLWGAIHKRFSELSDESTDANLDLAVEAYTRGYQLLHDYYNGINAAFLYDVRAHGRETSSVEAISDRVIARQIRTKVLEITTVLLENPVAGSNPEERIQNAYWIEATRVEALFGLDQRDRALAMFEEIKTRTGIESWMIETTEQQLKKLGSVI